MLFLTKVIGKIERVSKVHKEMITGVVVIVLSYFNIWSGIINLISFLSALEDFDHSLILDCLENRSHNLTSLLAFVSLDRALIV